jgi:hypothetical protein
MKNHGYLEKLSIYIIQYINEIVEFKKKQTACYVPLLLGITKAALIIRVLSAASFQETTPKFYKSCH